ncbi:hypothetical protein ACFE04_018992 [Oxalis oulophora]
MSVEDDDADAGLRSKLTKNAYYRINNLPEEKLKLVKCISRMSWFIYQIGGLRTVCFLEQVDRMIRKDYLYKRSVILIKAPKRIPWKLFNVVHESHDQSNKTRKSSGGISPNSWEDEYGPQGLTSQKAHEKHSQTARKS